VADLPLRPPALLGKATATLDLLTKGRVEVGLGARSFRDPLVSMGGAKLSDKDTLAALEEAIQVMHLMWSGERSARFEGKFYQLGGLHPGPTAVRHIGIWLAANDPQTLALIGRVADGWIIDDYPTAQPSELAQLNKYIDDAADAAGRKPSEIQRIWNIKGNISTQENSTLFQGSVKEWAESLADLALNVGIDTFLLVEGEDAEDQLRKFALEVVPHARELVELAPGVISGLARARQGANASGMTPAEEETDEVDWVDATSMESFPASDPPGSKSTA
jgi:alkanesulfonate monooxygenase SsuD/methylene tetrahydromethanopterin reductase-like flavin-dependent oxidoreductase (luciferase family)